MDLPSSAQPGAGYGFAGSDMGDVENSAGGLGGSGPVGLRGESGATAPSLTVVVKNMSGGLKLGLRGEDGGAGGAGGSGGAGGQGGRGTNAAQNAFNCMRGAGNGAQGGNGGTFTLITGDENVALITRMLAVDLAPGGGGPGGTGGGGGTGGPGGSGGADARPYCQGAGDQGLLGAAGGQNGNGASGQSGAPGRYYVGGLSLADINSALA